MSKDNITLIGMPGVGKSTVGVVLAKVLGYRFLDSDLEIQEQTGKLLHELIEEYGGDGFLEIENRVNAGLEDSRSVIATGGSAMVKAAYSSGTPAFGVGAGNSCSFVDDTADLADTAKGIMEAEMNDWGSGCSTENSVVIHQAVYDQMLEELKKVGGYLCNEEEKAKLINALWKNGKLNVDCIIHTPQHIAKVAGFEVPESCTFIMAEESHWGPEYMMTEEKLSPVVAVWKVKDVDEGIELINNIHSVSGAGHSCSIHSANEEHIMRFATKTHTSRVAVNACTGLNNAGAYNNKMPWTFSLGCGTWGGNAYSENNTFKHYYNTTWVYRLMPSGSAPDRAQVFGDLLGDEKLFGNYPEFQLKEK